MRRPKEFSGSAIKKDTAWKKRCHTYGFIRNAAFL
jgi:hypothetical protein